MRGLLARLRAGVCRGVCASVCTSRRATYLVILACVVPAVVFAVTGAFEEVRRDYALRTATDALDTFKSNEAGAGVRAEGAEGAEGAVVEVETTSNDADADADVDGAGRREEASGVGGGRGRDGGDDGDDGGRREAVSSGDGRASAGTGLGPRLRHVAVKGDKLACACGAASCASYDFPDVAYVLPNLKTTAAVVQALEVLHHRSLTSGESVEVLARVWPDVDRDAVVEAARRLASDPGSNPGGGSGLRSYRGEPLERVSLVIADPDCPNARSALSMASGAFADAVAVVHAEDLPPRAALGASAAATAWELPRATSKLEAVEKLAAANAADVKASGVVDVSFAMQYFRRPGLVKKIGGLLAGYKAKHGLNIEVIINDDSASEVAEWAEALQGVPFYVVIQGNVHEIRGYNRLAMMSRAETVAVIQDDDLPPATPDWLLQAFDLQREYPKLGLIAGMVGQIQGGPDTGRWGKQRGRHVRQIPYSDSKGRPFMFVSWANIGPFILRRSIFLKVGMFHQSFSCRGDPGIGFDYEYGIRLWKKKYEVGLTIMSFRYHQGSSRSSGTRASSGAKLRRDAIEKRNTLLIHQVYRGFYTNHAPGGANRSPHAKVMSLGSVCPAARLPTVLNHQRLRGNKGVKG